MSSNLYLDWYMSSDPETPSNDRVEENTPRSSQSVLDILSLDRVQYELKYIIGIFSIIGFGYGLTTFLAIDHIGGDGQAGAVIGAILATVILMFALMSGVVISLIMGFHLTTRLSGTTRTQYVTGFFGNMAGYIVMTVITVLFMGFSLSGGGGDGGGTTSSATNLSDLLIPLILLSIPVGLVCVGVMYLTKKLPAQTV